MKKEYIDRAKLIAEYDRLHVGPAGGARRLMVDAPAEDVVELKHGFWSHGIDGTAYAKCSACGRRMNPFCYGYAYCPLCGARMDGERKEK